MQHVDGEEARINVESEQSRKAHSKDIPDDDQLDAPAKAFLYPNIFPERRFVPHQQEDEDQAAGKEKNGGGHTPHKRPGGESGVVEVAKGLGQQGIRKMALQHHQNGIGAQQVNKSNAPVGEGSSNGFNGCMFFLSSQKLKICTVQTVFVLFCNV